MTEGCSDDDKVDGEGDNEGNDDDDDDDDNNDDDTLRIAAGAKAGMSPSTTQISGVALLELLALPRSRWYFLPGTPSLPVSAGAILLDTSALAMRSMYFAALPVAAAKHISPVACMSGCNPQFLAFILRRKMLTAGGKVIKPSLRNKRRWMVIGGDMAAALLAR